MNEELEMRRSGGYPPYSRLILITLSHEQVQFLIRSAEALANRLRELAESVYPVHSGKERDHSMSILGPVASPMARLKDRYRFQCMVKYRGDRQAALRVVQQSVSSLDEAAAKHKLQISVDVDPQLLM
jgi:primosomal protein N' (replication factor Y)